MPLEREASPEMLAPFLMSFPVTPQAVERIVQELHGGEPCNCSTDLSLAAAVESFLGTVSEGSLPAYGCTLRNFVRFVTQVEADPLSVRQVTRATVLRFLERSKKNRSRSGENVVAKPEEEPLSNRTRNRDRGILSSFFEWCVDERALDVNPVAKIHRFKVPPGEPVALSPAEWDALLELAKQTRLPIRNKTLLLFGRFAGLRAREVVRLRWANVDLSDRMIYVKKSKGGKSRVIPILPDLHVALEEYRAFCLLNPNAKLRPEDPLFLVSKGKNKGMSMKSKTLHDVVTPLFEALGKPKSVRFHCLRHTFAVDLHRRGVPLAIIQLLLGHAHADTTMGYLLYPVARLVEALNSAFPDGEWEPVLSWDAAFEKMHPTLTTDPEEDEEEDGDR